MKINYFTALSYSLGKIAVLAKLSCNCIKKYANMINLISLNFRSKFDPRFSYQSDDIGNCTFISQVVRFGKICNNSDGVKARILFLFDSTQLINAFCTRIICHKFNLKFIDISNTLSATCN